MRSWGALYPYTGLYTCNWRDFKSAGGLSINMSDSEDAEAFPVGAAVCIYRRKECVYGLPNLAECQ